MTKPYVCSNVFKEKLSNCFPTQVALIVVPLHLRGTFWKLETLYVLPRKTVHTIAGYFVCVEFWDRMAYVLLTHCIPLLTSFPAGSPALYTLDKPSFYLFQLVKYSKKYSRMNMFYWSTQRVILYAYGLFWISILIRDASTPGAGAGALWEGIPPLYCIDPLQNRTALEGRLNNTKKN